ncbi:class I SAM-dependent methyltransferase [Mycobacterium yunnanensis]|uniref:Class I SAM-dependent methyltransferase n=1 Tax=Mycobacterium yunnanensis TaxID=368477 RepID=A0A9X2YZJ1_9MYCO|nr:class I SAM-dependent methyltransferase [Mycobacterium yunnanensis]MCV7420899.1 class I SAM-dependent methyltransferase [Mycobacterium yunnanensis]
MSDAMTAEFDTVAQWTAEVAADLGADYHVPAGCRGSGSPAALDWLLDGLELTHGESLVDCGAGVGGPAAYAAQRSGVRPLLVEPEAGACRAARTLFSYPVVRGDAAALPLRDGAFDAAWALGVLCTTDEQAPLLRELGRVTSAPGRIGLLVLVARDPEVGSPGHGEQPDGNHFPTVDGLRELVDAAGLTVEALCDTADLDDVPGDWSSRVDAVTAELAARHGDDPAWQQAEHQSDLIGQLISDGRIFAELLSLRRR